MTLSHTLRSLVSITVILGVGLPLWYFEIAHRPAPETSPAREVGPVSVSLRELTAEDARISVEAYGTLEARRSLQLAFEVGGRLEFVHEGWESGAEVEKGELLLAMLFPVSSRVRMTV